MILCASMGWIQAQPASPPNPRVRQWTNSEGKTLTAEYLGVQGANVVLRLPDGKVTPLALAKFSKADNAFVKQNPLAYHAPSQTWSQWPAEVQIPMSFVDVKQSRSEVGAFVYTTEHFRFRSNVNLGIALMKDLAKVFELTYYLHSKSPFGILAHPDNGLFEARLFGTVQQYRAAGGPAATGGVYIPKEKVFLAPLDLMGVQPGLFGWRKVSQATYDPSAVIHELTHMLTNDMLEQLPLWLNEGFAEYIRCIPMENAAFKVSKDKIKQGVVDRIVTDFELSQRQKGKLKGAERMIFLASDKVPPLFPVAKVLQMTNAEWATGSAAGQRPPTVAASSAPDPRKPRLYRTAHLILYYFIQIEGAKGVTKLRRFLAENRGYAARYHQYVADHRLYEAHVKDFLKQPGVVPLPDGRVRYPLSLTPPKEPPPPFTDPNMLKLGGLNALLGGESAEVVGNRIQAALRQDLGINLRFSN